MARRRNSKVWWTESELLAHMAKFGPITVRELVYIGPKGGGSSSAHRAALDRLVKQGKLVRDWTAGSAGVHGYKLPSRSNPRRSKSGGKAKRQAWMRQYVALTGDPQPKPHDYWDGATYLFLSGKTPEAAAALFHKTSRSNPRRRNGTYYSVILPPGHTQWHAPDRTLSRGAFKTRAEARAWAKRKVPGYKYTIRRYWDGLGSSPSWDRDNPSRRNGSAKPPGWRAGVRGARGGDYGRPAAPKTAFKRGDRVTHRKHGLGTVKQFTATYGNGPIRYYVKFDQGGPYWEDYTYAAGALTRANGRRR